MNISTSRNVHRAGGLNMLKKGTFSSWPFSLASWNMGVSGIVYLMMNAIAAGMRPVRNT